MTYKVARKGNSFFVVELATNHVICERDSHDAAHEVYRFLKSGGAFAGFTPAFVCFQKNRNMGVDSSEEPNYVDDVEGA